MPRGTYRVPIRSPSRRGSAATARAGAGGAGTILLALLAGEDRRADEPAAEAAERLGRERRHPAGDERQRRPFVVGAEDERGEDLAADPGRADTVARVARAVVDPPPRHRAEERLVIRRDIDRPAPGVRDARRSEGGQQLPKPELRAPRRRGVGGEAPVDGSAEADRARAAAHQHAPVVRGAEVVDEHPPVRDRLTTGPADPLEQLGHRLGEDDVAPEVRQLPPRRPPARHPGVRRDHDVAGTDPTGRGCEHDRAARLQAEHLRPLVKCDSLVGDHCATQRASEARRLDRRALRKPHAAPEAGRANALGDLLSRVGDRHLLDAERPCGLEQQVEARVLRGRGGDLQVAPLPEPHVLAAGLAEAPDTRDDLRAGPGESQRRLVPDHLA